MVTSLTCNNPCIPIQYISDGRGKGTGIGLVHVETIPTSADLSGVSCAHHAASTGSGGASISNGVVAACMPMKRAMIHRWWFAVCRPRCIIHHPLSIIHCRMPKSSRKNARPKRNIGHQSVTNSGWSSYPKGNQELMPKC
jgi:hypothetical protein